MSESKFRHEVRIGWTDGNRYVGVEPPLTEREVSNLEYAGVIESGSANRIDEPDPACTLITVSSEAGSLPEDRDRDVQAVGAAVTRALNGWGAGKHIWTLVSEPVALMGENSTPFNPQT